MIDNVGDPSLRHSVVCSKARMKIWVNFSGAFTLKICRRKIWGDCGQL